MGLAPLRFLAWKAWEKKYPLILLYGDRHPVFRLPLESLLPPEVSSYEIFEEGREKKGLLTDLLAELVEQFLPAYFFVCGPRPMMKKVELWISSRAPGKAQFSFEEKMGCGYGACRGCVIPTREGLKRVCREGPVFKGEEVDWELI
jgi:dihydroorotate dehydrogenase electron transfer subunit